jgi:hypothetical protein
MAEWKVRSLTAYPKIDGKENVVYLVHWELGLIDAVTELTLPAGDFIPFEDLTEEVVLNWVWARISKADMEARAVKAEQDAKNPQPEPVPVDLPWSN